MKNVFAMAIFLILLTGVVFARGSGHSSGSYRSSHSSKSSSDVHVRSYTKSSGTAVSDHHRTNQNNTTQDNYSHKGNVNPYTGKEGTKQD